MFTIEQRIVQIWMGWPHSKLQGIINLHCHAFVNFWPFSAFGAIWSLVLLALSWLINKQGFGQWPIHILVCCLIDGPWNWQDKAAKSNFWWVCTMYQERKNNRPPTTRSCCWSKNNNYGLPSPWLPFLTCVHDFSILSTHDVTTLVMVTMQRPIWFAEDNFSQHTSSREWQNEMVACCCLAAK